MLKLKHLFENYDLAKEALKNWEHDTAGLDNMLSQFRISSNAIYPFCQNGNICFLRLAPLEEKVEKNIFGELEFIDYLLAHDYPALKPLQTKSGEICLKLNTKWGKYYAAAFQGVRGIQIESTDMSMEIMHEYGKTLGRLHSLSSQFHPHIRKQTYTEALKQTESILYEYAAPGYMLSELETVKSELNKLPLNSDNYGLVHYDFEPDNVFYDAETNICSVIDFDDGMYHWYALDIEQVFDSLAESLDGEALQAAKNEFICGYRKERPYTKEMQDMLPIMRRFINLYGYARLIRAVAEKFTDEPQWLTALREKLKSSIQEKEKSVRGVHTDFSVL